MTYIGLIKYKMNNFTVIHVYSSNLKSGMVKTIYLSRNAEFLMYFFVTVTFAHCINLSACARGLLHNQGGKTDLILQACGLEARSA